MSILNGILKKWTSLLNGDLSKSGRHVINMGHRGAAFAAPENTLPSFQKAVELGADGIELDVMLSRDGEVVVIHDFTLNRTTSGRGLVKKHMLSQLKQLDAGSWFSAEFSGVAISTLAEIVENLDEKVFLNIEIKKFNIRSDGTEVALADIINQYNLYRRVIVSSFNPLALMRIRRANNRIPVALLLIPFLPLFVYEILVLPYLRPEALNPFWRCLNQKMMKKAKGWNCRILAWTVNDLETMKKMLALEVDGIITDRPDILHGLLKNARNTCSE